MNREQGYIALIIMGGVFLVSAIVLAFYALFLRILNIRKARLWSRLEARWEPGLLEALCDEKDPKILWKSIEKGQRLYFIEFVLRFIQKLKGEENQILSRLAHPFLIDLMERLYKGDTYQRARAVHTLGILDFQKYAHEIVQALDDPSPLVIMVAARSITRNGRVELVSRVVEKIHILSSWSTQFLASMFASAGYGVLPILRQKFENRSELTHVRVVCCEALLRLNDLDAGDLATEIIRMEEDPELLAASLRLLKRVGRIDALPFIRRLSNASHAVVRAHALSALGTIGSEDDRECLKSNLDHSSPWVALHAARALKKLGLLEVLETFGTMQHPRSVLAVEILNEVE